MECEKLVRIFCQIKQLARRRSSTIFVSPVNGVLLESYLQKIENPMDLTTILYKIQNLVYESTEQIKLDLQLIESNCLQYHSGSNQFDQIKKMVMKFSNCARTVWRNIVLEGGLHLRMNRIKKQEWDEKFAHLHKKIKMREKEKITRNLGIQTIQLSDTSIEGKKKSQQLQHQQLIKTPASLKSQEQEGQQQLSAQGQSNEPIPAETAIKIMKSSLKSTLSSYFQQQKNQILSVIEKFPKDSLLNQETQYLMKQIQMGRNMPVSLPLLEIFQKKIPKLIIILLHSQSTKLEKFQTSVESDSIFQSMLPKLSTIIECLLRTINFQWQNKEYQPFQLNLKEKGSGQKNNKVGSESKIKKEIQWAKNEKEKSTMLQDKEKKKKKLHKYHQEDLEFIDRVKLRSNLLLIEKYGSRLTLNWNTIINKNNEFPQLQLQEEQNKYQNNDHF